MDNNVLVPKPHRILSMLKHTSTECTFRVACDDEPGFGQFFMLSLPKVGEAPISASGKRTGICRVYDPECRASDTGDFRSAAGKFHFPAGTLRESFPGQGV